MKRFGILPLAALTLAGCAALPRAAPTVSEVLPKGAENIKVVDIRSGTPSPLPADFAPLPAWTIGDGPALAPGVQPGDILHISVFEVGYSLFTGNSNAPASLKPSPTSGNVFEFPPLRVPESGTIQLPFAGAIPVTGRSGSEIARAFQQRLRGQSQNPQVIVSVEAGPRRSVVVSGDVKEPGRVELTEDNERLLDAIALAKGADSRPADMVVRLSRRGTTSVARLEDIGAGSTENVLLAPGDRIELVQSVRSITVLGAAKSVSQISFDNPAMTLSQALARAGGPSEDKADPTGVFIFRQVRAADGSVQPVIYRLNLLDPASYFAAQTFAMRPGDIMLVANAKADQLATFLQMVNALASPIVTARVLAR
ncbi:MAG TPA: polysaccharide biosynthesis/export family protein [Croceibacterium sp.]|jgi:polysaccharide export outer membrane protein